MKTEGQPAYAKATAWHYYFWDASDEAKK